MITNLRAIRQILATKDTTGSFSQSPLALSESVVMNQYRSSKGSRVGTFVGAGSGGGFAGSGVSSSSSTSSAYGDLVFFFMGKEVLHFKSISDPQGVRRMIETVKKQTKI